MYSLNVIRVTLASCALAVFISMGFFLSAQAKHPEGTPAPQINTQKDAPYIAASKACESYFDTDLFDARSKQISKLASEKERKAARSYFVLVTWAECINNMHLEIKSYKNSI
jgi:hypothetical protein